MCGREQPSKLHDDAGFAAALSVSADWPDGEAEGVTDGETTDDEEETSKAAGSWVDGGGFTRQKVSSPVHHARATSRAWVAGGRGERRPRLERSVGFSKGEKPTRSRASFSATNGFVAARMIRVDEAALKDRDCQILDRL